MGASFDYIISHFYKNKTKIAIRFIPPSPFSLERGPLEKESLGEYGSGWGWDKEYAHVFDHEYITNINNTIVITPMKYENGINYSTPTIDNAWTNYGTEGYSKASVEHCQTEWSDGNLLLSGSRMHNQYSCSAHSYNVGNYYSHPASVLNGNKQNSICSKSWRLPNDSGDISYSSLLIIYGIDSSVTKVPITYDAALINMPLSFLRSGSYSSGGTMSPGTYGRYRSLEKHFTFHYNSLDPTSNIFTDHGFSVRCVSR